MRTLQQQRNYEKLEQLPPQFRERVRIGLHQLCEDYLEFWSSASGEPKVRQDVDRLGNVYWETYDPQHHCPVRFDDEQKLLAWLDEKPYRNAQLNPWDMN
jgi:hypothetical protein